MLGYGASSKPEDVEYELELWRDQLVDFMQEVDPEAEWVVGGNSIGGLLSLMVTQARPEQVRGVVLFNSAGGLTSFRDEELPWYFRPIWIFVRVVLFGGEGGREAVAVLLGLEISACLTAIWCGWWLDGWVGGWQTCWGLGCSRGSALRRTCGRCVTHTGLPCRAGCGLLLLRNVCVSVCLLCVPQILSQVYGNKTAVDDELVNILVGQSLHRAAAHMVQLLRYPRVCCGGAVLPVCRWSRARMRALSKVGRDGHRPP